MQKACVFVNEHSDASPVYKGTVHYLTKVCITIAIIWMQETPRVHDGRVMLFIGLLRVPGLF